MKKNSKSGATEKQEVELVLENARFSMNGALTRVGHGEAYVFVCQSCGQESPKWTGKCRGCNAWNTLEEQLRSSSKSKQTLYEVQTKKAIPVSSIKENSAILKKMEL